MSGPLSITISPVGFKAKPGDMVTITVYDSGSKPIKVIGIPAVLHAVNHGCKVVAAPHSLVFSPVGFTLKPGESHRVKVRIISEPSPHIAAIFTATSHGKGNAHLAASVGAQITLKGKPIVCSPPAPATSGLSTYDLAWIGVGTLFIALIITLVIGRIIHRGGKVRNARKVDRR